MVLLFSQLQNLKNASSLYFVSSIRFLFKLSMVNLITQNKNNHTHQYEDSLSNATNG